MTHYRVNLAGHTWPLHMQDMLAVTALPSHAGDILGPVFSTEDEAHEMRRRMYRLELDHSEGVTFLREMQAAYIRPLVSLAGTQVCVTCGQPITRVAVDGDYLGWVNDEDALGDDAHDHFPAIHVPAPLLDRDDRPITWNGCECEQDRQCNYPPCVIAVDTEHTRRQGPLDAHGWSRS